MLKGFRWQVVWRVVLITALALAFGFILTNRNWFFTPLAIGLVFLALTWNLIYYVEKTSKDLTHFILSIKQGGFTNSFAENKRGKTFEKLSKAFNEVILEFQKLNYEREKHYQYLRLITEHIDVGILTFDSKGEVQLINPAGLQLLQKEKLSRMDELKSVNERLFQTIQGLQSGERQLLRTIIGEKEFYLSVLAKELHVDNEELKIILFQNLNAEIEEQEVDAWQKLIRVLTHEILNSVTPIVSLTHAVNELLITKDGKRKAIPTLDTEDSDDLYEGLQTIENRSKGLLRFVNAYKDFIKTPELKLARVDLVELTKRVLLLMDREFEALGIEMEFKTEAHALYIQADSEWLEQVLINIIKNAIEALENQKQRSIEIRGSKGGGRTKLVIMDNGTGMDRELLEKIFIPFFTTKKKGSGIGLSLSRQIMKLHKGNLTVKSELHKGTSVILEI